MKRVSQQRYERALLLKDSALEMVRRNGVLVQIGNAGVAREHRSTRFSVFYADPDTAEADDFHHLDVHVPELGKVFSIVWKAGGVPEVVTFRRGDWESFFLS